MGKKEFAAKWGKRKLEDNWRRRNKEVVMDFSDMDPEMADSLQAQQKKELSPKSREYYLQNIPLTDSAMEESHNRIKEALLNAGHIYQAELNENEMAIEQYEELVKRYPSSDYAPLTYYQLYKLTLAINDQARAQKYKEIILSRYPNSMFAKVILDPDYINELMEAQSAANRLYEKTYNLYQAQQYVEVVKNAKKGINEFPGDTKLIEKFRYIKILAEGKLQDVKIFKENLRAFVNDYSQGETSEDAQNILAYLDEAYPDVKQEEEREEAIVLYAYNDSVEHYLVVALSEEGDEQQMNFNLLNFNIDNYDERGLKTEIKTLPEGEKLVVVSLFNNANDVKEYYDSVSQQKEDIFYDVDDEMPDYFMISKPNYDVFLQDGSVSKYLEFFKMYYNK
jgi:hypothetical protein